MSPHIVLKPHEDVRILHGHPWIYDNEISHTSKDFNADDEQTLGMDVAVFSAKKQFLGMGFYNPKSHIRVRLFSRKEEPCTKALIESRIMKALHWRSRYLPENTQSYRLIFGESDNLPGLIADVFNRSWISMQILSAGMERNKQAIIDALVATCKPQGIIERSDAPVRALEGLPICSGVVYGSVPETIIIDENGLKFTVSLYEGQKTGWFLDQKANRKLIASYAKGRSVLDVFCNAGGFALNCLKAGAASVLAVDSSEFAIAAVKENARLNGLETGLETICANAFDVLRNLHKESYDYIILDPPAFAKNRASVKQAMRGYKEINLRAMRALKTGGMLATFSCSYWIKRDDFLYMLNASAADAGVTLKIIQELRQDIDHPIRLGYDESFYLKGFLAEIQRD